MKPHDKAAHGPLFADAGRPDNGRLKAELMLASLQAFLLAFIPHLLPLNPLLQVLFLLAAILVASTNAAEPSASDAPLPELHDIANSDVLAAQHYTWSSVDSGLKETHYKSYELFVRRPLHTFPSGHDPTLRLFLHFCFRGAWGGIR